MTEEKKRRKLRNFIILPRYQGRYILWITFTGLVLTLLNSGVFFWYMSENYRLLVEMSPMDEEVKAQLFGELHEIIWKLGLISFVFVVTTSFLGLIFGVNPMALLNLANNVAPRQAPAPGGPGDLARCRRAGRSPGPNHRLGWRAR